MVDDLDFEIVDFYSLTFILFDLDATVSFTSTLTLNITVLDENDAPVSLSEFLCLFEVQSKQIY